MGNAAHGRYALHLSNLKSHPSLYLQTPNLPRIHDVLWGRFYLYMNPAAPLGHGDIVRANDMNTNWYEVGFAQPGTLSTTNPTTGCYLSDWHTGVSGVPEKGSPASSSSRRRDMLASSSTSTARPPASARYGATASRCSLPRRPRPQSSKRRFSS
jgi:hypothetical protein